MKKILISLLVILALVAPAGAKDLDSVLPVRGFAIEAPSPRDVDLFVRFIEEEQVKDMMQFRTQAPDEMKARLCGYVHTIWRSAGRFLRSYYGIISNRPGGGHRPPRPDDSVEAAKAVLTYFQELSSEQ